MSISEIVSRKLENAAADVKVKDDKVILTTTNGCIHILSLEGDEINKKCLDISLKSADVDGEIVYAIGKDNMLRIIKGDEITKVRLGFSATRVFVIDGKVLVCGDRCDMFEGGKRLWSINLGQVLGKVRKEGERLYVPDNVLKRVHFINMNGERIGYINVNEKAFDLDIDEERIYVGTSKSVIAFSKGGERLWSIKPGWFNFVCSNGNKLFVATRNSKKLIVYNKDGVKEREYELADKPGMLDCNERVVAVITERTLTLLKLEVKKEEIKPSVKEVEKKEEEIKVKEDNLLKELKEISEGNYMGSPLAKDILKEVEAALESLEIKQSNLNGAIDVLLNEINELMNIGGADWKSVLERYERAYEKVIMALNLIENAKRLIGEVKDCPPIEEILKGLREESAAKFINFLVSMSQKEGSPAEKAKEGAEKVKLCVLKEVLKVDDEKVKELMQKKEKLEADISALKALLGET